MTACFGSAENISLILSGAPTFAYQDKHQQAVH